MNKLIRSTLVLALAGMSALASAEPAYPAKPIRLVVPFPPGGGTDIIARVVSNKLTETRKWVVVVDNRPGAGGNIGMDLVAKARPDGYTIGLGQTSNLAVNPTLYAKLPYDPLKDFTPIGTVADAPLVLVVASSSPYRSLADVVAAAKAAPDKVTLATPGNGTVAHLTGELFQKAAGIKLQHVPYKGSAQAITDLLGGSVNVFMSSVPTALSQIRAGTMRALAVTSSQRADDLPSVPTINESGYKGFDAVTWFGLLAPAGTPRAIIDKINRDTVAILRTSEAKEALLRHGAEPVPTTPKEFEAFLKAEIAKWGRVIQAAGIKAQ